MNNLKLQCIIHSWRDSDGERWLSRGWYRRERRRWRRERALWHLPTLVITAYQDKLLSIENVIDWNTHVITTYQNKFHVGWKHYLFRHTRRHFLSKRIVIDWRKKHYRLVHIRYHSLSEQIIIERNKLWTEKSISQWKTLSAVKVKAKTIW